MRATNTAVPLDQLITPPTYRAGPYEVRFAQNKGEVHAAQALR